MGKEVEILWEEKKEKFYRGHTKNYISAYRKLENQNGGNDKSNEKPESNIENTITKAKCIDAKQDHILVNM